MTPTVHVLGIRHHGPGSARAVRAALAKLQPDCVLIEGPAELNDVLLFAASDQMRPPVAGFVYLNDEPKHATFDPFASFSPEWIALRYALDSGKVVRFIDLPAADRLSHNAFSGDDDEEARAWPAPSVDPIAALAELAGYEDAEAWWEDVIEHRLDNDPTEIFRVISDAMAELRAAHDEPDPYNDRREAAMRQAIRAAQKEPFGTVAVVCGAWHAPMLEPSRFPTIAADAERLRGLSKAKVTATWVPWTHRRLMTASGYGAGVTSPRWYSHVFDAGDHGRQHVVNSWMVTAARVFRSKGFDASPASVVEAIRLADTLAILRSRPLAGLPEVDDAALAVYANGSRVTMSLVRDALYVGDLLGTVPDDTPTVPLARDLAERQKRLRMKVTAVAETVDLDLRKPTDRDKSRLLHRLDILDIPWGRLTTHTGRVTGTFHELWHTEWVPELSIRVVDACRYGTTIESAAGAKVIYEAGIATLDVLARLIDGALLADLTEAIEPLVAALKARVAEQTDVATLMDAAAPLVRIARYGDVRQTDAAAVASVLDGLFVRIVTGFPGACASLDDDAAVAMRNRIGAVHRSISLLDDASHHDRWLASLQRVVTMPTCHGLVAGRCARLLLDTATMTSSDVALLLSQALSRGNDVARGAGWVDGFLAGEVLLLIHDRALLSIIDDWLADVDTETFESLVPLLRRAFAGASSTERRMIGAAVRSAHRQSEGGAEPIDIDLERGLSAIPSFLRLIGAMS